MKIIRTEIDPNIFNNLLTVVEKFATKNKISFLDTTHYIETLNTFMQEYLTENGVEHLITFRGDKINDNINKR